MDGAIAVSELATDGHLDAEPSTSAQTSGAVLGRRCRPGCGCSRKAERSRLLREPGFC